MTDSSNTAQCSVFITIAKRDLLLAFRRKGQFLLPLMFFIIVISFFPLGITPDNALLAMIAPGTIWIAALLSSLLSLEILFHQDYEDGSLEQLVLSPHPLTVIVISKIFAHWVVSGLPLILVTPVLATMLHLDGGLIWILLLTLLLGTPVLSLVGSLGMALTVGLKRGGVLVPLLILPLYVPVLIFGANTVQTAADGLAFTGQLALMGAFFLLSLAGIPFVTSQALRISLS